VTVEGWTSCDWDFTVELVAVEHRWDFLPVLLQVGGGDVTTGLGATWEAAS
jgi:hypothetical protein